MLTGFASDEGGRRGKVPLVVVATGTAYAAQEVLRWANRHKRPLLLVSSAGGPRRRVAAATR